MAKIVLLVFAVIFASIQCAVIKDVSHQHKRVARSPCPVCAGLPPPPLLHTQNWSGLARTADGLQNAVFSGASAAAEQGVPSTGEAFSLASSAVNNPGPRLSSDQSLGYSNSGVGSKSSSSASTNNNVEYTQSSQNNNKFGSESYKASLDSYSPDIYQGGNTKGFRSENSNQNTGFGTANSSGQTGSFDTNAGNNGNFGAAQSRGDVGRENYASEKASFENQQSYQQQQSKTNEYNAGRNRNEHGFSSYGQYGNENSNIDKKRAQPREYQDQQGFGSARQQPRAYQDQQGFGSSPSIKHEAPPSNQLGADSLKSNYNGNDHQGNENEYPQGNDQPQRQLGTALDVNGNRAGPNHIENNNFGSDKTQLQYGSYGRRGDGPKSQSSEEDQFEPGKFDGSGNREPIIQNSDPEAALKGALKLTAQGLQAARQADCSSCGKSSYAYSKAKSYSGSAIALSIGG